MISSYFWSGVSEFSVILEEGVSENVVGIAFKIGVCLQVVVEKEIR